MQSRKHFTPPMVGGSSLLIIFAVLCLTIFTLLALSTVKADSRLLDASVIAVSDYYAADLQAEMLLSQLRRGQLPEGVQIEQNIYSYSCPISDTQTLMVEVRNEKGIWTILRWQAVSTAKH